MCELLIHSCSALRTNLLRRRTDSPASNRLPSLGILFRWSASAPMRLQCSHRSSPLVSYVQSLRAVGRQTTFLPLMTLTRTATIARTNSTWMNPPIVYEVTSPRSHRITSTTAIVKNMIVTLSVYIELRWNFYEFHCQPTAPSSGPHTSHVRPRSRAVFLFQHRCTTLHNFCRRQDFPPARPT